MNWISSRQMRAATLLTTAIALAGCGPVSTIEAGVKVGGVDVFFGRPVASPQPPPVAFNLNPEPTFPAPLEPAPVFRPLKPAPIPSPTLCPDADPLANPAQVAPVLPASAPAEKSYVFRYTASETQGSTTQHLPPFGFRRVTKTTKPDPVNGSYQFTVEQNYDNQVTSMVFDVEPIGTGGESLPGVRPAAGIYLTQMTDDAGDVFQPQSPGVLIMPLPVAQGATFQGAGTSPSTAQTMEVDPSSVVNGKARVNACGTVLDSWEVHIVGKMVDAASNGCPAGTTTCGQQKDFDLTFDNATQFGGLIISDHLKETGTDPSTGQTFVYDIAATINSKPS
jgi:hypothetical protein